MPIEVKTNKASAEGLVQLRGYLAELSGEAPLGVLIASDFQKSVLSGAAENRVRLIQYKLNLNLNQTATFDEICRAINLDPVN